MIPLGDLMTGKDWAAMSRKEKLETWDMLEEELRGLTRSIEEQFNKMFETEKIPLRVSAHVQLIPISNEEDPRLG